MGEAVRGRGRQEGCPQHGLCGLCKRLNFILRTMESSWRISGRLMICLATGEQYRDGAWAGHLRDRPLRASGLMAPNHSLLSLRWRVWGGE